MVKRMNLCLFLGIDQCFCGVGQEKDAILGNGKIQLAKVVLKSIKKGMRILGSFYWLRDPNNDQGTPKLDVKNPDPLKKVDPVKDLEILTNFVYKGKDIWADGKIYDPKSGIPIAVK